MKIVHVWDITTKTWFAQSTTAEAGLYPYDDDETFTYDMIDIAGTGYCSVVASAEDNSSHNIYLYIFSWDIGRSRLFILTLPAFHWVSVYEAPEYDYQSPEGGQCRKVHEKHMVVYRGKSRNGCDYEKNSKRFQGMAIYDMSSLTWTTKVELKNPKYLVPEVLHAIIGGK